MNRSIIIDDLDYTILLNTSITTIQSWCVVNKHLNKLCQSKRFWIDKMKHDGIMLTDEMFDMLLPTLNWFKVYCINDIIYHTFFNPYTKISRFEYADAILKYTQFGYYKLLFKYCGLKLDFVRYTTDITSLSISIYTDNTFIVHVTSRHDYDEVYPTDLQLYELLFTAMMDDAILNFTISK